MLAYEMLTCRLPFEADIMEILTACLSKDPPHISVHRDGLPEELQRLVMKMVSREADDRFPTLVDCLRGWERVYNV